MQTKPGRSAFDRFDMAVLVFAALLAVGIGVTLARGDQIGLQVARVSPQGSASFKPIIQITFDEPVDEASIEDSFKITPDVAGNVSVSSRAVTFRPAAALTIGQRYTVTINAGVVSSQTARTLKEPESWTFTVRRPRAAYLGADPNNPGVQNIFVIDPAAPDSPQQITRSETGITSYDASDDGSRIAFTEFTVEVNSKIYMWESATGNITTLFECIDSACINPVWRPDGNAIAFERTELNTGTGLNPGVQRVWVLDLVANRARPVFTNSQIAGYGPRWSPDGKLLALYNIIEAGISVYDFTTDSARTIPTAYGDVGDFSPDGGRMFFPRIITVKTDDRATYLSRFVIVDVNSTYLTQTDTIPPEEPVNDVEAAWIDADTLVIARRPPYTAQGTAGPQLYTLDLKTGQATALLIDDTYSHGGLVVSPLGDQLLVQRFALGRPGARPELWMVDLADGKAVQLANNATAPRWMP